MKFFQISCIILLTLISLVGAIPSFSVPARPVPIIVEQPDGDTLTIFLRGDEHFHYFSMDEGEIVCRGERDAFYYATHDSVGFIPSGIMAHSKNFRNGEESNSVNELKLGNAKYLETKYSERRKIAAQNIVVPGMDTETKSVTGEKKGLVILVEFADNKMYIENAADLIDRQFNERGFCEYGHIGSVSDYFHDQSYGKFNLSFDVVGPVTVSKDMAYYGANVGTHTDYHAYEMVYEACRLVDDYVNFSDYDWDGDGIVDQVYIVYAGYGEAYGAPSTTIWPHESSLLALNPVDKLILDDRLIDTYACSSELAGYKGTQLAGIGTACHEFSHCLGLPDFYDIKYNGGFGMDHWDIMCSGSYNGPTMSGEVPCGYTAYERNFVGWLDYVELDEIARISGMPSLNNEPVAYVIYNDNNRNEYFLLENRQNEGWFAYVRDSDSCHGLLISHIDYDEKAWMTNTVNTVPSHQRMSMVVADCDYGYIYSSGERKDYVTSNDDLEGDLFPGRLNVCNFTDDSHYDFGGKLFNENIDGSFNIGKPVTNIKEAGGYVSFDFLGGIFVERPVVVSDSILNSNSFIVNWECFDNIESFEFEAEEVKSNSPLEMRRINEKFNMLATAEGSSDGKIDVSIYLDSYTSAKGWRGKKIFTSQFGAKIGGISENGYISTPFVEMGGDDMTVRLKCKSGNGPSYAYLTVIDERSDTLWEGSVIANADMSIYILNFDVCSKGRCSLSIKGDSPVYLSELEIYDGHYSEEDLKLNNILAELSRPNHTVDICGIHDYSYTLDNMTGQRYKYRLRSYKDEAWSEWTDYRFIDFKQLASENQAQFDGNCAKPLRIFNLQGQEVNDCDLYCGRVYIFDYGTFRKKILIRK